MPPVLSDPRTVVFALYDKVTLADVAAPLEIFARANDFGANYTVLLASLTGTAVGTTAFAKLDANVALDEVPAAVDTLVVPGGVPAGFSFTPGLHDIPEEPTPDTIPDAVHLVRHLAPRARRVASVCTGAFVLAALGLLNGRRATTHWAHCQTLARNYPHVRVDPDSLFVQDGRFFTGAGYRRVPIWRSRWWRVTTGQPWRAGWRGGWSCSCNVRAARPSSACGPDFLRRTACGRSWIR